MSNRCQTYLFNWFPLFCKSAKQRGLQGAASRVLRLKSQQIKETHTFRLVPAVIGSHSVKPQSQRLFGPSGGLLLHLLRCVFNSSGLGRCLCVPVCLTAPCRSPGSRADKTKAPDWHLGARKSDTLGSALALEMCRSLSFLTNRGFFERLISMCWCSLGCMQIRLPSSTVF